MDLKHQGLALWIVGGNNGEWKHSGVKPGLPEDFVGSPPEEGADPRLQEGSGHLGGPEGRGEERVEEHVRTGSWTEGVV